ncbi:MAG TPA: FecR domain-containing protein [Puia sp.]|nr:FecR domain-containing protein [Puia sp.]
MIAPSFEELFNKFIRDEISAEEIQLFVRMVSNSHYEEELHRLLRRTYSDPSFAVGGDFDPEEVFEEMMQKVKAREMPIVGKAPHAGGSVRLLRRYSIAVAVLLVFIAGASYFFYFRNGDTAMAEVIVSEKGQRKSFQLPDGSSVVLNGGSRLIIPAGYNQADRRLTLEGEGYFNVARDSSRPFTVHTRYMDVKALGTVFNVSAYPDEGAAVASLLKGKILVSVQKDAIKSSYVLHPMEKIVIEKAVSKQTQGAGNDLMGYHALKLDSLHVNALTEQLPETAWTENKLFFDAATLSDAAGKIEKWYDVTVQIDNDAIKDLHFTGTYQNEKLLEVLEALCLANSSIHYRLENNNRLVIFY